jgi:FtsZ-binding cell division protein ZapB
VKKLNLNAIRIDGGTQPRERINMEVVGDYAEAVKVGVEFPPVIVFHDGAENWLADGFHRWHAHNDAGKASIAADIRQGSLKDAKLYAASREANGTHGLRRSNADKRLCVLMTLTASPDWSDNRVAEHVGVDHKTVAAHRAAILGNSQDTLAVRTVARAGKTYQQDTSRIGKSKPVETSVATPREAPEREPSAPKKLAPWDKLPEPTLQPALDDAQEAVKILSEENDRLNDRLAVEAMDASEEEKNKAADTITGLRAELKTANAELSAVKASRDTYMRENAELKKTVAALQRKLRKFEVPA